VKRQQRHSNTTMSHTIDLDAECNVLPTSISKKLDLSTPAEVATTTQQSVPSPSVDSGSTRFKCDNYRAAFGHKKSLYRHLRLCCPEGRSAHQPELFTCSGKFLDGRSWGCGRSFGRVDSLARHHKYKECTGSRSEQQEGAPYTKVGIHPCGCYSRSSLTA
jgi:hypothetical protein